VGARRRSTGHGPRYGLIYLAEGMERVPPSRRGAFARSLASLATVALRADLLTHRTITESLLKKRETRISELIRAASKNGRGA
jgi:RNA processing factor Prp31